MTGIHLQLLPESLPVIHSMEDRILIIAIKVFLNANRLARAGFLFASHANTSGSLKENCAA